MKYYPTSKLPETYRVILAVKTRDGRTITCGGLFEKEGDRTFWTIDDSENDVCYGEILGWTYYPAFEGVAEC